MKLFGRIFRAYHPVAHGLPGLPPIKPPAAVKLPKSPAKKTIKPKEER